VTSFATKGRVGTAALEGYFYPASASESCGTANITYVDPDGFMATLGMPAPVRQSDGSGGTFCVTSGDFIDVPGTYSVWTNQGAMTSFTITSDGRRAFRYCAKPGACARPSPSPTPTPTPPPLQRTWVMVQGQPAGPGGTPARAYIGRFTQAARVEKVELDKDFGDSGFGFKIMKQGRNTDQCGDPSASVLLMNNSSLTPSQMRTLFGSETPMGPLNFVGCITTNFPATPKNAFTLFVSFR
jgi:hypothetical protein